MCLSAHPPIRLSVFLSIYLSVSLYMEKKEPERQREGRLKSEGWKERKVKVQLTNIIIPALINKAYHLYIYT